MIQSIDAMLMQIDQLIDDDLERPGDPVSTGGPQSLVGWEQLGRRGRMFVAHAPAETEIAGFLGAGAKRPIRVYVGLGAADTPEERAALALEEMKRVNAFDRSLIVVATPTGTGWIDEAAVDALEYLHRGDTAIVAQQYSYLSSYVSVFLEPGYAQTSAAALFRTIHRYWRQLPRDKRPRLFLHGLSLGSYGSEQSMDVYEILSDPVSGAVWSGPTYANPVWSRFVQNRNAGSPP